MEQKHSLFDKLGMGASAVCLVHCLLLPIIIASVPFAAFLSFMHDPMAESLLVLFAVVNAVFAVTSGLKKHKNFIVPSIFITGAIMLLSFFFARDFVHSNEWIITIGALLIGIGHIINFSLCKHCSTCKINYESKS